MAGGSLKLLAVQALALVTGIAITAYLTRQLGPELYGLFSVAATIVLWIELSATVMLGQTTVKFLAEAVDWRAVASTLTQAQLVVALGAALLLVAAAPVLAAWLKSPELADYLRLFAVDIPLFALTSVHRSALTGRQRFGQVALASAVRWLSRLALVLILVGLGLSLTGAILASIGASIVQLIVLRLWVRPALWARPALPLRRLAGYALPLFLYTVGMRLFRQLDLLMVKALGGAPELAGYYGAAQNLTIVPLSMFGAAISPLLLATLTRLWRLGKERPARAMAEQALRLVLCLLPFVGLVVGSAPDIVILVYGRPFLPAASLVTWLTLAGLGLTLIRFSASVLTARGQPGLILALTGPLAPLALGAHGLLVPRLGSQGAALATTALAWLAAGAMLLAIRRLCGVTLSSATILRTLLAAMLAYLLSSLWPSSGAWVLVELSVMAIIVLLCLFGIGELTSEDLAFLRSLWRPEGSASP
jgi:O-antigen/teichoic acid export membrane protein